MKIRLCYPAPGYGGEPHLTVRVHPMLGGPLRQVIIKVQVELLSVAGSRGRKNPGFVEAEPSGDE